MGGGEEGRRSSVEEGIKGVKVLASGEQDIWLHDQHGRDRAALRSAQQTKRQVMDGRTRPGNRVE